MLGDVGPFGNYFVSAVFFAVGLHLLGFLPLPILSNSGRQPTVWKKGLLAALLLGLIFGATLVLAYAIGHCSVIVFAGTSTEILQKYLRWNERSRALGILKKVCGVLVILGAIYLILTTMHR